MEHNNRESIDFEEMVQKAVNMEANLGPRSSTMVRDSDAHCPRGHRSSQNTFSKVQTQGSSHKDLPRSEKPKPKDPKPAPSCDNVAEPAKKEDKKNKKKRLQNQRQEHICEQTPTTDDNTKAPKKKIKARCFIYNKKSHYANECTKPLKNKCQSRQLLCR